MKLFECESEVRAAAVFLDVKPINLVGGYWRFGGTRYLHVYPLDRGTSHFSEMFVTIYYTAGRHIKSSLNYF